MHTEDMDRMNRIIDEASNILGRSLAILSVGCPPAPKVIRDHHKLATMYGKINTHQKRFNKSSDPTHLNAAQVVLDELKARANATLPVPVTKVT